MTRRELLASAIYGLSAAKLFAAASDGAELVGKTAPPLQLTDWINSPPLEMNALRGKVVLLRWWTEGCPFCAATAPSLRNLDAAYRAKGLEIIGVYHPKPRGKGQLATVQQAVAEKQFTFPVAIDWNWTALNRWWLFKDRDFTSVSFLVDREGVIRYVHPGGEFHSGENGAMPTHAACQRDMALIENKIVTLLSA